MDDNNLNYSLEESAKQVGVSTEIFTKIFIKYVNLLEGKIDKLKTYISINDFKEISTLAHSLKGSSGNMNVTKLYDLFRIIELNSKEEKSNDYKDELYQIQEIYKKLKKLKKIIQI